MIDYKEANKAVAEAYKTRIPDYDITPVLQLLAAVSPKEISSAMAEAIISMADDILIGTRKPDAPSQDMLTVLKLLFRAFDGISFDREKFSIDVDEQIEKEEGLYAKEPIFLYPSK